MMELAEKQVESVFEQVKPNTKGHWVSLVGKVELMVVMDQVVLDNQVNPEKDHRFVLVVQHFFHTEHVAAVVVQQVAPVVGRFPPQEHKIILVDSEVDQKDQRVFHIGPKVFLVKVGLVDLMVVPLDQKKGPAKLKVVPERVVLVSQRVA